MMGKWEDKGRSTTDLGNWPPFEWLPGGHEHNVRNTETGETRTVHVHDGQDVGEAVAEGQFTDDDD
jgi:hypothetical protein